MRIPKPVRLFFARMCWKNQNRKGVLSAICIVSGLILILFVFGFFNVPMHIVSFNPILFILGYTLFLFGCSLLHPKSWTLELPEYKTKKEKERIDKILDEANKILKELEFIGDNRVKKLRCLIVSYNNETRPDAVERLEIWIANYKDMQIRKDHLMGLRQTEKTLPTDIETIEGQIKELCTLLE